MRWLVLVSLTTLVGLQSCNHLGDNSLPPKYAVIDLDMPIEGQVETESLGGIVDSHEVADSGQILSTKYKYELLTPMSLIKSQPAYNLREGIIPLDINEASIIATAVYQNKMSFDVEPYHLYDVYMRPMSSNKKSYQFYFKFYKGHLVVLPDKTTIYRSTD